MCSRAGVSVAEVLGCPLLVIVWVDGEPVLGSLSPSGACASPQLCSLWSGIILRNYIQIWMPERLCSSWTLESDGTVLLEKQIQRQVFDRGFNGILKLLFCVKISHCEICKLVAS